MNCYLSLCLQPILTCVSRAVIGLDQYNSKVTIMLATFYTVALNCVLYLLRSEHWRFRGDRRDRALHQAFLGYRKRVLAFLWKLIWWDSCIVTEKQLNQSSISLDVLMCSKIWADRQGVTIFWLQIIDDVSVQKSGKIKLRGHMWITWKVGMTQV